MRGPDILGYFSTNLRDSPFIRHSLIDSTTDGTTRARKFANMRIRLVDVEGEKSHSYIGIAEDLWSYNQNLEKGRLYR